MTNVSQTFEQLGICDNLLKALKQVGYETPSPFRQKASLCYWLDAIFWAKPKRVQEKPLRLQYRFCNNLIYV